MTTRRRCRRRALRSPPGCSWQWLRCAPACVDIAGADAAQYVLTAADRGAVVRVRQTVSRDGYDDASALSAAGAPVAAGLFVAVAAVCPGLRGHRGRRRGAVRLDGGRPRRGGAGASDGLA